MTNGQGGDLPPAGWYPDPEQPGQQRWWDGEQWTDHRAPSAPSAPSEGSTPSAPYGGDRPDAGVPGWEAPDQSSQPPAGGGWTSSGGSFDAGGQGGGWGTGGGGVGTGGGGWGAPPAGGDVSPWLWQSIVATLFCCLPAGVVAIVFAAQAQSAIGARDWATAREKAGKARTWTIVSVVLGLIGIPILFALGAFEGMAGV